MLDRAAAPHIDAVAFRLKKPLDCIFAVPERGAIGTNSLNQAITVIDLSGGKPKFREVLRRFKKYVSGGNMIFLPEFSRDAIGYTETRGFLLFNVKTGEFRDQLIVRLLDLRLQDVAVIDWEKRLFLFNVEFLPGMTADPITELHLVDLSGAEPKTLATVELKQKPRWAELGKTTFYYTKDGAGFRLHALDERLSPVEHPLLHVYGGGGFAGETALPIVHPTLPVALISAAVDDGVKVWAASWRDREKPIVHELFADSMAGDFRYSPDGKWVVFHDSTEEPLALFAMPVDPALPQFFGPPIHLATREEIPDPWNGNCAWISDPVSVVCNVQKTVTSKLTGDESQETVLLKWELSAVNVRR